MPTTSSGSAREARPGFPTGTTAPIPGRASHLAEVMGTHARYAHPTAQS